MKIQLTTVIWGEVFVKLFLKISLKSLLSEGNLISISKNNDIIYTIYTTPEDEN